MSYFRRIAELYFRFFKSRALSDSFARGHYCHTWLTCKEFDADMTYEDYREKLQAELDFCWEKE